MDSSRDFLHALPRQKQFAWDAVLPYVNSPNATCRRAHVEVVAHLPADVLARTAAFLRLKHSRSSFEIEGEQPPQGRIQRWSRAIGEAGRKPIDLDELLRLQRIRP